MIATVSTPEVLNRQVRLKERPTGMPDAGTWTFTETPVPVPKDGEFAVKNLFISIDPAMRVWLNAPGSEVVHVTAAINIGDVMRASVIGRVTTSRHVDFMEGDLVAGRLGVQEYAVCNGFDMIGQAVVPVTAHIPGMPGAAGTVPASAYLGVLGVPGLTGYFGLLDVGKPQPGETVVVSGATGAVGSVAGQVARIKGCRVVGIAGGPEKCRLLVETLGFDAAVDYRAGNVEAQLAAACPKGIDVYFDNTGGQILDAALANLAVRGRVVMCGSMSQYTTTGPVVGPANYRSLLLKRGRMEGFIVYDYATQYEAARAELSGWLADGSLIAREDVMEGIDSFPRALNRVLAGEKFGKLLIRLTDGN
ncbi:MAG: NADP-dependent oxidoreductase [Comamonadaceae bacterium]|nr:MAG: NADP-dependent oxidoreductase [Comamonadaceae bacterium]